MALIGNTFYQSSAQDPGAGYPMYYWHQTNTGLVYIRNAADNAWVLVGDSAQPYLGQLSTQGGTMNGAITGAHGLSPANTNDFTSLFVGGLDVATKSYVDTQDAALNAAIASGIASALASVPALNLGSRVAYDSGEWTLTGNAPGNTIALPFYSDGIQASDSECIYGAYFHDIVGGYYVDKNYYFTITESATRVFDVTAHRGTSTSDYAQSFGVVVHWWIMAFRKTS